MGAMKAIAGKRVSEFAFPARLVTVAIVIAALYFGQEVLIPFALALLLSFLLTPPVTWLERLKLGRVLSVLLVLGAAFTIAGTALWMGATQLADIVSKLPQYQENIDRKIQAMRNPAGSVLATSASSLQKLSAELAGNRTTPATRVDRRANKKAAQNVNLNAVDGPVPVEVVPHQPGIVESLSLVGMSLVHFAGLTAGVLILTLFMLMQRGDLRNRFFRLLGTGYLNLMTTAMDDAAQGVGQYLLTQSIINGSFGLLLGLGLYWIGVPNAPFWGVLGAVLRFVPYIGTLAAGFGPLLMALAVFEGWSKPLMTLGLFAGIEMTISAGIEPWVYGAHTGISSLAILVSAAFWALLWGPIGLVLSTPLTVCLLALGRYVPPLQFLTVLLGDDEVLSPEAAYYQRLLALDGDEAQEIAENYLKDKTFGQLYDNVLIPALALAERDRHENALDEEREEFIYRTTRELLEEFCDRTRIAKPKGGEASSSSIVCMPARDEADALVGTMLAHVLRQAGYAAAAVPIGTVDNMLEALEKHPADVLFVSALPPLATRQSLALCRRARRDFPQMKIAVGFWGASLDVEKIKARMESGCFDNVVTSLTQAEVQAKLYLTLDEAQTTEADRLQVSGKFSEH